MQISLHPKCALAGFYPNLMNEKHRKMCVCQTVDLLYAAFEHLYSVQSAVKDLMNVSDYAVMDTLKNCCLFVQVH
jgi:hypothetical protein